MTIRLKITLLLILSILVIAVGVFVSVRITSTKLAEEQFLMEGNAQLDRVNDLVRLFLQTGGQVAISLSQMPERNKLSGNLSNYTQTTQITNPDVSTLNPIELAVLQRLDAARALLPAVEIALLGTTDGGYIKSPARSFGVGYDPRTRPWYKGAIDSTQPFFVTDPYISSSTKTLVTTVATKIKTESGQVAGVTGVDFVLSELTDILRQATVGKTGYLLLFDKSGNIMLDPKGMENLMKKASEAGDPALALLAKEAPGLHQVVRNGGKYIALSRVLPGTGWKAVMIMEEAEELALSTKLMSNIAMTLTTLALIILGAGIVMSGTITKALVRLMGEVRCVAEGKFDALEKTTAKCGPEITALHKDIRQMVARIQELIQTSEAKAKEAESLSIKAQASFQEAEQARKAAEQALRQGRLDAASQLEGIADTVFSASTRLAEQVTESGRMTDAASSRLTETATAMEEMNATVMEVARSAGSASQVSTDAKVKAELGAGIVEDVVKCINDVERQSTKLRTDMMQLGQQAEAIGAIMNVISDIADQTNLLALNAAIEAARAGEAGRGFAVVADEVRKLAEKTMQATVEVSNAIKGVQQSADKNMNGVDISSEIIAKATALVRQAGTSLTEIVSLVEKSADQVRTIATAAEEQSSTSEEINRSLGTVSNASSETARSMAEAAHAVSDLSQQAKQLSRLIDEMKRG